ncbi:simple sugar transport system permease protein/D-xylose transport system permease protein [Kribbella aluminosa]|uniref:Xylose transport system permease protein XylH n=1 Tax=Kribbella aluminosa TaxID=416017 RepID=A0ABS4UYZ3_9ACTN|nr:sugar ABC transporter permease [Kribbella aluminosa]MBP2356860.1 simple sugar transport system permease protein/D-xylose transport system permease protein [Kribbella aluminosa]
MSIQGSGTRPQDTAGTPSSPASNGANGADELPADLQDERLIASSGISGAVSAFTARLRSGDLGSVPVVIGLIIIWAVFQIANGSFLSSRNLVNLTLQTTSVGVIALGIVLVLLLGEIDLSVGSVSGLSGAVLGVTFVNKGWPLVLSLVAGIALGLVIGLFYGALYTRFGVPSFVITLAGLLGFLGLQLLVLGKEGSLNLPYDSALIGFATRSFLSPAIAYALIVVVVAVYALTRLRTRSARAAAGLSAAPMSMIAIKAAALAVVLLIAVLILNGDRGVSSMFLLFLALVVATDLAVRRTRWGRAVVAVGGNVEAARRAGINVRMIYLSVFAACSTFAAVGGLLAAARLVAVNQSSGGGDTNLNAIAAAVIGGTSLFGGRGSAYSALLGALVIMSISNGLALLSLDSSVRYMVTAGVLLIAVTIDSLSRRSRQAHGRA